MQVNYVITDSPYLKISKIHRGLMVAVRDNNEIYHYFHISRRGKYTSKLVLLISIFAAFKERDGGFICVKGCGSNFHCNFCNLGR